MYLTRNNVETTIDILTLITKRKHTVSDAQDILNYASRILRDKAKVPQINYRQELKHLFEDLPEDDEVPKD